MIFRSKVDCKPKSLALFIFTWILCFLCFATSAYGSDYSQFSLANSEKGLTDISDSYEKINQLLYLSEQYQDNAADKALDFANQALNLSYQLDDIEVKGKGLFHMYFYEGPLSDASPQTP